MKIARLAVCSIAAAVLLVPLTATGAFAAPPNNDKPNGAVALTLGQTYNEDTTQATTGKLDTKLNGICGAPDTNASVWFTYTPTSDGPFLADLTASDYPAGLMVFKGKPTVGAFRGCGPDSLVVNAKAGSTYFILAFSASTQQGGNLVLSLEQGPPPPTISASLDATGQAFANGNAKVSGTVTCTNADAGAFLTGSLTQIWKRVKIVGYINKNIDPSLCTGAPQPWSRIVESDNGLYAGGDAAATIQAEACGVATCARFKLSDQPVTLRSPGGQVVMPEASPTVTVQYTARPTPTWATPQHS